MTAIEPPSPKPGPPPEALLRLPEAHVFKSDRRSRVWRVDTADGSWVIKRFEFSSLWQRLALALRLHPAQREVRWSAAMTGDGLSVAPIAWRGVAPGTPGTPGIGCKAWLISPCLGLSLLKHLREGRVRGYGPRRRVTEAVAQLAAELIRLGYTHRDLKTSNILMDDLGKLWLIDVGAVRRSRSTAAAMKTLAVLDAAAVRDGVSRAERLRCLGLIVQRCPSLGDVRVLARALTDPNFLKDV